VVEVRLKLEDVRDDSVRICDGAHVVMKRVFIERGASTKEGRFGRLRIIGPGWRFECVTLELPWRENGRNVSCIPTGVYRAHRSSSSKGLRYRLENVYGRGGILIHAGNFAGAVTQGFRSHSEGCILVGLEEGVLHKQRCVLHSRAALTAFEAVCLGEPIEVEIKETSA
jgi:hypothetical protein